MAICLGCNTEYTKQVKIRRGVSLVVKNMKKKGIEREITKNIIVGITMAQENDMTPTKDI
jgi:hypothetical protein